MKLNVKQTYREVTHEGARAARIGPEQQLRRSVMACMLWEDTFYEDGETVAARIARLVALSRPEYAAACAYEARTKMKLRHVPLLIVREMARLDSHKHLVGQLLADVIQRPDEITEFLAVYWKDKRQPLSAQVKKGLAGAFTKFNEYSLAKYNRDGLVKLRDALFLCHAKPVDGVAGFTKELRRSLKARGVARELNPGEALFLKLVNNTLATPDTWEVNLSAGADKKETFERLMAEKGLGALAFLRNLRNMLEAGVNEDLMRAYLLDLNVDRVLPFRFISAARYAPRLEDALEGAMYRCLADQPKLPGKTALLIDHSGSMRSPVSAKSEISRFDAAGALAILLREVAERCRVFTFSDRCIEVPPRRGFAMIHAVQEVVNPVSTLLGAAVRHVYSVFPECERLIVVTDEQSQDRPPQPRGRGYVINVAGYQNGIGAGEWFTINGWSEAVIDFIREIEA